MYNNKLNTPIFYFTTDSYYYLFLFVKTKNYFLSGQNRDPNLYRELVKIQSQNEVACLSLISKRDKFPLS